MDLQTQRLQIIEEVLHLDSENLEELTSFLAKKKQDEVDFGDIPAMPFRSAEDLKAELEQSLEEARRGEGIPHEEVVAYFKQRWASNG